MTTKRRKPFLRSEKAIEFALLVMCLVAGAYELVTSLRGDHEYGLPLLLFFLAWILYANIRAPDERP